MPNSTKIAAAFGGIAAVLMVAVTLPAEPAGANKAVQGGSLNSGQIRFCENQNGDTWRTYHAPRDETFFHQEVVLGEGSYSLAIVPSGSFRFNAFVYDGETNRYLGGARDVRSYTHRFNAGSFGSKYIVQLVKTTQTCRGCSITMSLRAFNCPENADNSRRTSRPPCARNQCYDPGTQDLFGLPLRPPKCIPKRGANGDVCGTRGN